MYYTWKYNYYAIGFPKENKKIMTVIKIPSAGLGLCPENPQNRGPQNPVAKHSETEGFWGKISSLDPYVCFALEI